MERCITSQYFNNKRQNNNKQSLALIRKPVIWHVEYHGREGRKCCEMLASGHDMAIALIYDVTVAIVTCTSQPNARIDGLENL